MFVIALSLDGREFQALPLWRIGFHFGTLKAAYDRYSGAKKSEVNGSYYKDAYVNMKNPVFIDYDPMRCVPFTAAYKLNQNGIISNTELESLEKIEGFRYGRYAV